MPGRFGDYPAFFTALARERMVACTGEAPHPRLRILGLLEARLLSVSTGSCSAASTRASGRCRR